MKIVRMSKKTSLLNWVFGEKKLMQIHKFPDPPKPEYRPGREIDTLTDGNESDPWKTRQYRTTREIELPPVGFKGQL